MGKEAHAKGRPTRKKVYDGNPELTASRAAV